MNAEDYYEEYQEKELTYLLTERLKLNRTWDNVSVETKGKKRPKLHIRWFDPKVSDPDGKETFQEHSVPFTTRSVHAEIGRQQEKLEKDRKDAVGRD